MVRKLGRGLDSLIEETSRSVEEGGVLHLEVGSISPNPYQPRTEMGEAGLEELARSIREHGILQPILVRPAGEGYQLVAGERRWRAARAAGLERVPATVREIDEGRMLEIALVENLQREDLDPIEKARAYRRYLEDLGLTHEVAARRLGKDRSTITNQVRLLELSDEIQGMVSRGTLSMGHARALLGVADPERREDLARRIAGEGLSVRETERLAREARPIAPTAPRGERERSVQFEELERRLRERFATKARITGTKKRGRIVLEYFSLEELNRLLEMLVAGE